MKTFIADIRAAILSREFLSRFKENSFGSAFGFILKLCLLQMVVVYIVVGIGIWPSITPLFKGDLVEQYYPQGLEVYINNGIVSTTAQEPYYLPAEKFTEVDEGEYTNTLVIDTSVEDPFVSIKEYDTALLLSKNTLAYQKPDGGEVRIISLAEVENLTISKDTVKHLLSQAAPFFIFGMGIFFILLFIFLVIFCVAYYLLLLLILALLTWLITAIRKTPVTYGQSYILSAYALALPILVDTAFDIFSLDSRFFLTLGLFALVVIANVAISTVAKEPTI